MCSSKRCNGIGNINHNEENKEFILIKPYTLIYYEHIYYIKNIFPDNLWNKYITIEKWILEKNRYHLF